MLFWTPHFSVLDSTFFVLDSTFWLDSTLKIDPGRRALRFADENALNWLAGWYLRQKPVGGSKAGGLPTLSFPLSLPSPFPFPLHPFLTSGREGQIHEGEVPRLPPTNITLLARHTVSGH